MTTEEAAAVSTGEPHLNTPQRRGGRRAWRGTLASLIPLAGLAFIAYFVRLPYFVLSPGPARDVKPLIHIDKRPVYPSRGSFLLTAVSVKRANLYEALHAWIDPVEATVPERDILAPGRTEEEEAEAALYQMDTSKIDAAYVALRGYGGYPRKHGLGALVESVGTGVPAEGKLFAGDLILAVDGAKVQGPDDVGSRIREAGEGGRLTFTVRAGGKTRKVSVAPAKVRGYAEPIVGVSLIHSFPFPVTIESGDIGGPSAGLMWTLGLIDLLTPGDLAGGRRIAGTGAITLRGQVLPIGGVQEKVVAAENAGAAVFFTPRANAADARSVAHSVDIVPVGTYRDAVAYLESRN